MTANGYEVSFLGDENVLKLDSDNCTTLIILKTTYLVHFKRVNVMACESYLNKVV